MMTIDEVMKLTDEILDFFESCGGVYEVPNQVVERSIILTLVYGQYIIHRSESGLITHFISYFKVNEDDIPVLAERGIPGNIGNGNMIYISQLANNAGSSDMWKIMKELRPVFKGCKGLLGHHRNEGLRFYPCKGA